MYHRVLSAVLLVVCSIFLVAQQDSNPTVPRFVRFSGVLAGEDHSDLSGTHGITFSLYKEQTGGAPLWREVQNVTLDTMGHYSVVLGSTSNGGVPAELFMSNEARWLSVQVEQQPEQPRVLLVSVPYALKAGDAETVGGHPLSDFVLSTTTTATTTSGSAGSTSNGATKPKSSSSPSAPLAATTVNAVAKFSDTAGTVTNSQINDNGTGVGIGSAGTAARLTVGNGVSTEEALHIDGAVPVIRMLSGGALRWGWLGEFPAAGQSTFWNYTNGKPLITLNSTGRVGIGALNPSSRLTVGDGSSAEEALHIDGTVPIVRLLSKGTLRWGWLGEFPTAGQSTFWNYTNGKALLTLNSAGRVGVGGTNPSSRLTVGDGVTGDEAVNIDAGGNASIRMLLAGAPKWAMIGEFPAAGGLGFYNYALGSSVLTLSGNGNVGIANAAPGQKLSVGGMIESTTGGFKFPDGSVQASAVTGGGGGLTFPFSGSGADSPPTTQGVFKITDTTNGPANTGGPPDPTTVPTALLGVASGTGIVAGVVGEATTANGVGLVALNTAAAADATNGSSVMVSWSQATSGKVNLFSGLASSPDARGLDLEFAVTPSRNIIRAQVGVSPNQIQVFTVDGSGNLSANGTITANGTIHSNTSVTAPVKTFRIDDPIAPADKWLYHTSVESPDMMTIYNGVVVLDARGQAWIQMPDWFEALNMDFRYQLTAVGQPAPNLYIAREIKGNRFQISGGRAHGKVSWQVTGIRHDAWANAHRTPVEQEKSAAERGKYMYPEGFGHTQGDSVTAATNPARSEAASPGASQP